MMKKKYILFSIVLSTIIAASVPQGLTMAKETTKEKISAAKEEAEEIKEDLSDGQDELDALNNKKETVTKTLKSFTDDLTEITDAIADLDDEISEKQAQIEVINNDLVPLQDDLNKAEYELDEAKSQQSVQYAAMKKRIQYMYEHGDDSLYEVFLKSKSFSDLVNKRTYIEKLAEYDRKALKKYQETTDDVARREEGAQEKLDAVLLKKENLEAAQADLEDLRTEQMKKQDEISSLIEAYEEHIEITNAQIKEAEENIAVIQKQLDEQNADIKNLEAQLQREQAVTKAAANSTWTKAEAYKGTTSDRYLMANIIFCEAGNQPFEGQVAVGAVIMNRVRSGVCPNTISGVVYQKGQFEPVSTGRLALALARNDATESCYKAADAAMAGQNPIGDCLFFRTPISGINYKYKIGGHIFY